MRVNDQFRIKRNGAAVLAAEHEETQRLGAVSFSELLIRFL